MSTFFFYIWLAMLVLKNNHPFTFVKPPVWRPTGATINDQNDLDCVHLDDVTVFTAIRKESKPLIPFFILWCPIISSFRLRCPCHVGWPLRLSYPCNSSLSCRNAFLKCVFITMLEIMAIYMEQDLDILVQSSMLWAHPFRCKLQEGAVEQEQWRPLNGDSTSLRHVSFLATSVPPYGLQATFISYSPFIVQASHAIRYYINGVRRTTRLSSHAHCFTASKSSLQNHLWCSFSLIKGCNHNPDGFLQWSENPEEKASRALRRRGDLKPSLWILSLLKNFLQRQLRQWSRQENLASELFPTKNI